MIGQWIYVFFRHGHPQLCNRQTILILENVGGEPEQAANMHINRLKLHAEMKRYGLYECRLHMTLT